METWCKICSEEAVISSCSRINCCNSRMQSWKLEFSFCTSSTQVALSHHIFGSQFGELCPLFCAASVFEMSLSADLWEIK